MLGFPLCFVDDDSYERWKLLREMSVQSHDHCWDCLPHFKALAERHGLCAHPETTFVEMLDEDGESVIHGIRNEVSVETQVGA